MSDRTENMHILTHSTINDLQEAFQHCGKPSEGLILAALVKVRAIHDLLLKTEYPCHDGNADGYWQAA